MSQTVLIWGALLVAIGAISWYRSGKKTGADLITQQDTITVKICIQMALEILGSLLEPDSVQTPADAINAGKDAITKHGMSCAIVVNVLAQGLLGGYIAKHRLSNQRTGALMLYSCRLLADGYKINEEELWDRSGELVKHRGPLGFLMQKGMQEGTTLPSKVKGNSVLTGLVLDAVEQAGG
jgi:hypothetical protein